MEEIRKSFSFKDMFVFSNSNKNIVKLCSLGFGLLLISWLISQLEWDTTLEVLRNVPLSLLLLGFLCYALSFYLRARRFKILLPDDKQVKHLFPIVLVHYTALNIIPARLGEISYVYLLKKVNNISTGYSVSSLLMARVFDQIAISVLFLCSSCFVRFPSQWHRILAFGVGAILLTIVALLLLMLAYKEQFVRWIRRFAALLKWDKYRLIQRILHEMHNILDAFKRIRVRKYAAKVFGLSLLIWLCIFSVNYVLLRAFYTGLTYGQLVLVSTVIILIRILPFQLLGGFGIHEISWVFLLVQLGVPKNVAIISGLGSHLLCTLYLGLFSIYGFSKLQASLFDRVENT